MKIICKDGKASSTFPALYFCTRPSKAHKVKWPAVNRVALGKNVIPEKWTLTVTKVSGDAKDILLLVFYGFSLTFLFKYVAW
jgi:hypothetical protein